MQDGKFYDGATPHPTGYPIFVFASSKCKTWEELIKKYNKDNLKNSTPSTSNGNKISEKFDDFISRIHGHLDISTLNYENSDIDKRESSILLRRAILMRAILERNMPSIFLPDEKFKHNNLSDAQIDDSLLELFLYKIQNFTYNARSLESILQICNMIDKKVFNLSCLPTSDQISGHIGSEDIRFFQTSNNERIPRDIAENAD